MCGRLADYISKAPLEVKCIFFFKEAVLMTPAAIREQFFSVLNDTKKIFQPLLKIRALICQGTEPALSLIP